MPDCFVSFASVDAELAQFVKDELECHQLTAFMAASDLRPGANWTTVIWQNLRASKWVFFLASRAACQSPYVQQELGGALHDMKNLIPIVWDMSPAELPGWVNQTQALDMRNATIENLRENLTAIGKHIKNEKDTQMLLLGGGAVLLGLLLLSKD